ncbi:hypothetical protein [Puniceicoccus vermicola]|uniref:Uncharacterized protein n=1 Tax=Puniceicoccus vermicola TaxID=388746 RepID=A0A7X1AZW0_9BACT|nr:hypothetical protein [Puniceicoccus vermicola]MBC2602997.1 hypothetical protein [Puniceicoccus vermicola]
MIFTGEKLKLSLLVLSVFVSNFVVLENLSAHESNEDSDYYVVSGTVISYETVEYMGNKYSMLLLGIDRCYKGNFDEGKNIIVYPPAGGSKLDANMIDSDFSKIDSAGLFRIENDSRLNRKYYKVTEFYEKSLFEWPLSIRIVDKVFGTPE